MIESGHKQQQPLDAARMTGWVFDLDNTIYPAANSLFPRVAERMTDWIANHFGIDPEPAAALKARLFREHGTTMHGLINEFGLPPDDFLAFVHDIDLSDVTPDAELDAMLASLPGMKHIYTNGTTRHAERILEAFGIRHHFEVIFDIEASNLMPKPDPRPYRQFLELTGLDPTRSVMIEDMARNLEPAAMMGMQTVWLVSDHEWAKQGASEPFVHYIANDLKEFLASLQLAEPR